MFVHVLKPVSSFIAKILCSRVAFFRVSVCSARFVICEFYKYKYGHSLLYICIYIDHVCECVCVQVCVSVCVFAAVLILNFV